jgi:dihydroorotate dehydrogenase (NAD+) catalytic subunit
VRVSSAKSDSPGLRHTRIEPRRPGSCRPVWCGRRHHQVLQPEAPLRLSKSNSSRLGARAPLGVPIIASIFADTIYEFGTITRFISEAEPDILEVNVSCPNLDDRYQQMFAADPYVSAQVTRQVRRHTDIPVLVKLSPNVTDISEIAEAVVEAGADGITAINSVGPGLILNVETRRPALAHGTGGMSGPPIRPIAVRCVRDICKTVDVPVVATGGVTMGRDVVEMLLVGATAVSIGSAVRYRGIEVFHKVCEELKDYMARHGHEDLASLRGTAILGP